MRKTAAVCSIPSCVWFIKHRHTRAKINVVFSGYIYSARTENSTRQFDYTMRSEQFLLQKLNLSTAHWTYWQYVSRIVFCSMLWVIVHLHVCSIVWWVFSWFWAESRAVFTFIQLLRSAVTSSVNTSDLVPMEDISVRKLEKFVDSVDAFSSRLWGAGACPSCYRQSTWKTHPQSNIHTGRQLFTVHSHVEGQFLEYSINPIQVFRLC